MFNQHSPEILALRDRVMKGNDKLNAAWEQIRQMNHSSQQWRDEMERWHQANERLSILCTELKARGYNDCLYLDETGKKTRGCLTDALGCRVCPSGVPYWEKELTALPSPRVRRVHPSEQQDFVEKLGGLKC